MLRFVTVAAVLAAVLLTASGAVRAAEGPWCAILNLGSDASEDCQYRSFEECYPRVIAGQRGFCNPNPRWQGKAEPKASRKRLSQGH